jgi:3-hydroxyacyl-[acyl-carrier-protein] dehydratase
MPPKLLVDLSGIDLTRVAIPIEKIRAVNPQRYEMEQLSGVITYRPELGYIIGFRDVRPDEFWVRGHIPGRPLFPGVLMIEAAAQLSSFYYKLFMDTQPPARAPASPMRAPTKSEPGRAGEAEALSSVGLPRRAPAGQEARGVSRFVGFGGVTDVKFRRTVEPGDRLIIIAVSRELKSRRAVFDTQEVVGDKLVFEGTIIGMPVGDVPRSEGTQG